MNNNNNNQQPQIVRNTPVGCHFCGAEVHGKITEEYNGFSKKTEKIVKWTCPRCLNVVRKGKAN